MNTTIPPRDQKENKEKVYWPQTTIPYGEDTAFTAAKVYAQHILKQDQPVTVVPYLKQIKWLEELLTRAAELLRQPPPPAEDDDRNLNESWRKQRDQWLRDSGFEK